LAPPVALAASQRANDQEGLSSVYDRFRELRLGRFVREVLLTRKKTHEGSAAQTDLIANAAPQDRIRGLDDIEHRSERHGLRDFQLHLTRDPGEGSQVNRKKHPDHFNV
jgi:hypothetical protein